MGERLIDPRFEGLLIALEFLRERRKFETHAVFATHVRAHGVERRFIRRERPEAWGERSVEERAYCAELAAAMIARVSGEHAGSVLHLPSGEQERIVERAMELDAQLAPPVDEPSAPCG